jgi:cell shape-determining protein MreD
MTYFFYICVCLCLIIFQTAIMPSLPLLGSFYDLLCPFVIYLGLFRPARESIPVILIIGVIMDSILGGAFGLYVTTYVWLFIGVKWMISYLHLGNNVLLALVVAAGVLLENFIFIGTMAVIAPEARLPANATSIVGGQVLWAIFTGPLVLMAFDYTQKRWNRWVAGHLVKRA